jgi:hypothetical protein
MSLSKQQALQIADDLMASSQERRLQMMRRKVVKTATWYRVPQLKDLPTEHSYSLIEEAKIASKSVLEAMAWFNLLLMTPVFVLGFFVTRDVELRSIAPYFSFFIFYVMLIQYVQKYYFLRKHLLMSFKSN